MSRALARRRRRGIGNPTSSDVSTALTYLAGGAAVGAAIGVLGSANKATGALAGAEGGLALVGVGGLVVAVVSSKNRPAGFATAGIGLGGLALLGLATTLIKPAA